MSVVRPAPPRARWVRACAIMPMVLGTAVTLAAQSPAPGDSARRLPAPATRADSTRIQPLASVRVRVMTDQRAVSRVPWAVGVVTTRELRRAQPTINLDEALSSIPGVFVASRYNFATDSRLAIRGAGARANFGLRGVRVFLDGVPQTLPDGQSQLTNVELGNLERVEVLRGATASLYGNGSAGVLAFQSDVSAPRPLNASLRTLVGSFGQQKTQLRVSGRGGRAVAAVSVSRLVTDGVRQWSQAEFRQVNGAVDYALSPATTVEVRVQAAEVPDALNPGALTAAEYAANRDSASAANIRRGADRRVRQDQFSVSLRHQGAERRLTWVTTTWVSSRTVLNALSTAPPGPVTPTNGIFATLDRFFAGARSSLSWRLGEDEQSPSLGGGIDVQQMRDRRRNFRSTRGRVVSPTDSTILDQFETVTAIGPFLQAQWSPARAWLLSAGARYDALRFAVTDDFLADRADNTGARRLPAWSGHVGLTWQRSAAFAPYANVATAFETPTTTELQVRPDRQGGFNPDLGPQRTVSVEAGARGAVGAAVSWNLAVYSAVVRNAIVQSRVTDGTAFFENAGRTHNRGVEAGLSVRTGALGALNAAWTVAALTYDTYRVRTGTRVDTLDGRTIPGVPREQLRLGYRSATWHGATLDVDHTWTSSLFADDANTLRIPGWGRGVLNARAAWSLMVRGRRVEPFAGVQNAGNQAYIGAVTTNGVGGRVIEPAPRRTWYLGLELGTAR